MGILDIFGGRVAPSAVGEEHMETILARKILHVRCWFRLFALNQRRIDVKLLMLHQDVVSRGWMSQGSIHPGAG